jgi:hypothetical protein
MPLDASDFPYEVQVAFFVFSLLPDKWDPMAGAYLGKDWSSLQAVLDIYEIDDPKTTFYLAKMYEKELIEFRFEESDKKRKAEERKANAAGGKQFTHNVKG